MSSFSEALNNCTCPEEAYVRIIGSEEHSDSSKEALFRLWMERHGWTEVPNGSREIPNYRMIVVEF
jgi:hypothetical protein